MAVHRLHLVPIAAAFVAGTFCGVAGYGRPALAIASLATFIACRLFAEMRAVLALALVAGVLSATLRGQSPAITPRSDTFHGAVVERVASELNGTRLAVRLDDGTGVELFVRGSAPPIGYGITVHGRLEPLDEARNPGEPSPRALGAERGIDGTLEHARILAADAPDERDASLWLPRVRAWASERIHAALDEPYATIVAGAMWGERGTLPSDLRAEFQDTGTVHVLVTAGLHLGVVAALSLLLLRLCGADRRIESLGAIAVVWIYAALSGAHVPSLRAAAMATFALLARAAGRKALSWNALAAAAIVVAALRPASVATLPFALSFSCVASIVAFAEPIARAVDRSGLPHALREPVALSVATQIGTWPLTAFAFLVFAPYAALANLLVVPAVGVIMLGGFALLAATPIPPLAAALGNVETTLCTFVVAVVRLTASLPGAHVTLVPPPVWAIGAYDASLAAATFLCSRGRRTTAFALVACAALACALRPAAHSGELVVTAIDVGQADALLVQTPAGHAYLIDAGGKLERGAGSDGSSVAEDVGVRVVVPFLIRAGVTQLDAVLLSHPHGDHAGGIAPVLRSLGAGAFADSGQSYPGHAYADALAVARDERVPMLEPRAGDRWKTDDGVRFSFHGPALPYLSGTRNDINNNSLVFTVQYGKRRMLFTGDAGAEAEARMLSAGDDLHADVLKVGHHGSAYSSTAAFIRAVAPSVAIISVGRRNLFGHPAQSTLDTLAGVGARVYRTDRSGAITVRTDGDSLSVTPFLGG